VDIILLVLILSGAVAFDFRTDKIPNPYIITGVLVLLTQQIISNHSIDLIKTLISVIIPIIILLPLFILGFLGGGDIKLIAMIGFCMELREVLVIFIVAVLIGAIGGLLKGITNKSLFNGLKLLTIYLKKSIATISVEKKIPDITYLELANKEQLEKNGIHFSAPILLSTVLVLVIQQYGVLINLGG
jgi:Flp pilus assembly protein protease CpaA